MHSVQSVLQILHIPRLTKGSRKEALSWSWAVSTATAPNPPENLKGEQPLNL